MLLRFFTIYLLLASQLVHSDDINNSKDNENTIIVVGDSLSAAYGIELEEGWVNLLRFRLQDFDSNTKWNVINASISGDTTAGGLERLTKLINDHQPVLCIIALGANDGLRGQSLSLMHNNLERMVNECSLIGTSLLIGMMLPPNYGEKYTRAFHQVYTNVAQQNNIIYVPFMLQGIALQDELFQADRLHPTAEAQPIIFENIWAKLREILINIKNH